MPAPSNNHSSIPNSPRQTFIGQYYAAKQTPGPSDLGKEYQKTSQNLSSDEFDPGDLDLRSFDTVDTAPEAKGLGSQPGSSDREYGTPPDESLVPSKIDHQFRKPEPVQPQMKSRKRSYPGSEMPSMSRSIIREKRSSGYSRSHSANEIGSEFPSANDPSYQRSFADTELTRSFSSVSTTSLDSSTTRPSTAFTTPNISFRADPMNTSFDSANEEDDSATMTITRIPSDSRDLRSTSAPVCSKPVDSSDDHAPESMEIDKSLAEIEADEPSCINGRSKQENVLLRGRHVEDYLQQNLFQDPPFGKLDQSQLQLFPANVISKLLVILMKNLKSRFDRFMR